MSKNIYDNDDNRYDRNATIRSTEETVFVPGSLAFRSIGYGSVAVNGLSTELNVAFDERRGIIPNDGEGRAYASSAKEDTDPENRLVPGCYCAGWVKRGPTGVIASTMEDAFASAEVVMADWMHGKRFLNGSTSSAPTGEGMGWEGVLRDLGAKGVANLRPVSWKDWQRIDAAEAAKGKAMGKPREKFRSQADMLRVLD